MSSFEAALLEELAAIPWLDDTAGRAYVEAIGEDHDAGVRELKDAVLMREPLLAPADALAPLGRDRMVLRAPVHTNATYATWLDQAADLWEVAGTAQGWLNVFVPYGFTAATVQFLSNHEVGGFWDGNEDWFSRVFGFVDSRSGYWESDGTWEEDPGSGELWSEDEDPGAPTWDSSATVGDLAYIREQGQLWKGEGAYPTSIAVWLDTDQMPDGYWDSPGGLWPEDVGDAGGAVWVEDEDCHPLYWTLGNVWGQEAWLAPGSEDVWTEGDEEMVDLVEEEKWIAFPGEE
jgi:hypothetical protein